MRYLLPGRQGLEGKPFQVLGIAGPDVEQEIVLARHVEELHHLWQREQIKPESIQKGAGVLGHPDGHQRLQMVPKSLGSHFVPGRPQIPERLEALPPDVGRGRRQTQLSGELFVAQSTIVREQPQELEIRSVERRGRLRFPKKFRWTSQSTSFILTEAHVIES